MKLSTSQLAVIFVFGCASLTLGQGAISTEEIQVKSAEGLRLLRLAEGAEPVWKTWDETLALLKNHIGFFDVTEVYEPKGSQSLTTRVAGPMKRAEFPTKPSQEYHVKPLLEQASLPTMQGYLYNLTAFNNRFYNTTTGREASHWIRDTVAKVIEQTPGSNASVRLFNHPWHQPTIIATIPGTSEDKAITILGAHMDSINVTAPVTGRAPGADDDGSGVVNLMEAFRLLVTGKFKPRSPVEFQWYAAEEVGLLGSQAVAKEYHDKGVNVKAMFQYDMTSYVKPGSVPIVGLMPDFTDQRLTAFVASLIETYTSLPWVMNSPCGYACSDHASWNQYGYPTVLPHEGLLENDNPAMHSQEDSIELPGFNWTHTFEFAKLATAFAYELSA